MRVYCMCAKAFGLGDPGQDQHTKASSGWSLWEINGKGMRRESYRSKGQVLPDFLDHHLLCLAIRGRPASAILSLDLLWL